MKEEKEHFELLSEKALSKVWNNKKDNIWGNYVGKQLKNNDKVIMIK